MLNSIIGGSLLKCVSKDDWEDIGKSKVMCSEHKNIKPVALAIIELCLSEGCSVQSVSYK